MAHILDFLTECFHEGFQFSTIAGFKYAISAYQNPIWGIKVGSHPIVSALLSGIFNNRPPQPKYIFARDVKRVIEFLTALPYDSDLILKNFTLKLTLTLTSTLRFLTKNNSGYIFHFRKNTEISRKGKLRKTIIFIPFDPNKNLCVCLPSYWFVFREKKGVA